MPLHMLSCLPGTLFLLFYLTHYHSSCKTQPKFSLTIFLLHESSLAVFPLLPQYPGDIWVITLITLSDFACLSPSLESRCAWEWGWCLICFNVSYVNTRGLSKMLKMLNRYIWITLHPVLWMRKMVDMTSWPDQNRENRWNLLRRWCTSIFCY